MLWLIGFFCVAVAVAVVAMFPAVPYAEQLAGLSDHITRWTASGQTLVAHLYTNNLTPTPNNVLADYTELTSTQFPGYAGKTITQSGTPFINAAGNAVQINSDPVFQPNAAPPSPVEIYGYFVTLHPTSGPDTLLYGCKFDTPIIVSLITDAVPLDPDISQVAFSSPESQ